MKKERSHWTAASDCNAKKRHNAAAVNVPWVVWVVRGGVEGRETSKCSPRLHDAV